MVRISKQGERRSQFRRRHRQPAKKTGPVKDNLPEGYKPHANAVQGELATQLFVPKIK